MGNSSRRFSREPSIRLLAKLSVWLCLVIFNQAFCPSPNKLSGGGAGDTLHVFFMAKTLVHAFITSAWLVWGAHGGHSSISSTARKKENQRDRTFFLFFSLSFGRVQGCGLMLPVFYCVYACTADRCTCGDVCCVNSEI